MHSYLCETYDQCRKLLPTDPAERIKLRQWVHAAEATFMVHALAILYARWHVPKDAPSGTLDATERGMSILVQKDLSWLESELAGSSGRFLCGDHITAADVMMHYSADVILSLKLGTQEKAWPEIQKWLRTCEETEGYKRAVEKTGYKQYTG